MTECHRGNANNYYALFWEILGGQRVRSGADVVSTEEPSGLIVSAKMINKVGKPS